MTEAVPWREQFGLVEGFVFLVLMLMFVRAAVTNYESPDHYLGRTMPAWQMEIVGGTAPAPYVYRQGVPQLRRLVMTVLQPGHAALAVDAGFAVIALGAGFALGVYGLGRGRGMWGMVAAYVAAAGVYTNDKPESVAMVAAIVLVTACFLHKHYQTAALALVVSAAFRPELPILFGGAVLMAAFVARRSIRPAGGLPLSLIPFGACVFAGLAYLAVCKFLLWPQAKYPQDTPAFMLMDNFTRPLGYPGMALNLMIIAFGFGWIINAWRLLKPAAQSSANDSAINPTEVAHQIAMGLFIATWSAAATVLGRTDEIRIVIPLLPLIFILASLRWLVWRRVKP